MLRAKFGFLVNDLGPSQLSYFLLKNSERFLHSEEGRQSDIIIFYNNLVRPCLTPKCAIMPISEAQHFDGITVATNLITAHKLIKFPGPQDKFFYLWDLEWLRLRQKSYHQLHNIYCNHELTLLARSSAHAEIFFSCWGREPKAIVEDVDIMSIYGVSNGKPAISRLSHASLL